jgi:hypothetical protein
MALEPEELLACAERMTAEERARFCELVDPAHPDAVEADIDAVLNPFLESGVQGPQAGTAGEFTLFNLGHHEPVLRGLFRSPSPELIAQFLYKQMTHKELVVAAPKGIVPDADITASMETAVVTRQDIVDRDRWMRARARWEKLFGEAQIPLIRNVKNIGANLDLVEGILYDKETKGVDPPRCPCGCGFVAGCGVA